jgi:hypothetical protein
LSFMFIKQSWLTFSLESLFRMTSSLTS